jgi:Beta-ketoacyl synthase, N-terminal domain
VAGVNLTMRAETTAVLAKAGMLTQDGRCKTLDSSADGYARGEACVVRKSVLQMTHICTGMLRVLSVVHGQHAAVSTRLP